MASSHRVTITTKPSHADDIEMSWVRVDNVDLGMPEKGAKTIQLGAGNHLCQMMARGRPGGTWTVTIESKGLVAPDPEKTTFTLELDEQKGFDFISWTLVFGEAS